MYSIMIVDDEPRQRRGLASVIAALRPDYRIVEASDGEEAAALFDREPFQIVVTDIRMPNMNGLQFMEHMGDRIGKVQVILLTGYASFEYARKAVRLGAAEYLLKPVSVAEFAETLERAERSIGRIDDPEEDDWTRRESLCSAWLRDRLTPAESREWEKLFGAEARGFAVAIESTGETDGELLSGIRIAMGVFEDAGIARGCEFLSLRAGAGANAALLLLRCPDGVENRRWEDVEKLLKERTAQAAIDMTAGVGGFARDWGESGRQAFERALSALESSFYAGKGTLILGEAPLAAPAAPSAARSAASAVRPADAVRAQDPSKLGDSVRSLFQGLLADGRPRPSQFVERALYALRLELEFMRDLVAEEEYAMLMSGGETRLRSSRTLEELEARAGDFLLETIRYLEERKQRKHDAIMDKCTRYIGEHYKEEISLDSLAQSFYFNPSYFSGLFKAHTGCSFSDYLLKVRMKEAVSMLAGTDLKVNDVALEVGYKDPSYFIRVFKREYGVSPGDYRRMTSKL